MARRSRSLLVAGAVAVVVFAAGCSGDDESTPTSTTAVTGAPQPLAVGELDDPAPGEGRVVLGSGLDVALDVVTCEVDLAAEPDGEVPAQLVTVRAGGETADGTPVLVDITRFRSAGAATTITDNVAVLQGTEDEPLDFVVAQRFEVGGQVTDGRDPDADDPLLRLTGDTIRASGVFAPPGAFAGDPAAIEGAVVVACP